MEVGIFFIIITMFILAPIAIIISKTRIFKSFENKFFEDHNHYM